MRQEGLLNSKQSPGMIIDKKTGQVINNISYSSGYFDGIKLGGVRLDTDSICGKDNHRCDNDNGKLITDVNGNYTYKGSEEYPTFQALLDDKSKGYPSKNLFGPIGGFQPIEGGWYFGNQVIPYKLGSYLMGLLSLLRELMIILVVKYGDGMEKMEIPQPIGLLPKILHLRLQL